MALREALKISAAECDDSTLAWFLRDRKLNVEKAVSKVCSCRQFMTASARRLPPCSCIVTSSLDVSFQSDTCMLQVRSYLDWRAAGNSNLSYQDVAKEAATGKAVLLPSQDLVRPRPSRSC